VIEILNRHAPPIINAPTGKELSDADQRSFRDAPVFILLLADWRAKVGLPGHPTEKNEIVKSIYNSSLASAFLYMHLAAASLGLASQWYSAASRPEAEREIGKIVGFPEALSIYEMMVLGYPAAPLNAKEVRSLGEMIHYDDCGPGDFRTDDEVSACAQKTYEWCMAAH
jgi:nitroreductase